ncbi:helix-turn-helix domain-containing protein [Wenzhouxiangella marina]|uniref:Uncharacterized protein n=1 Tax=Wenzhouxiangella marina TaxID=1579979 RepID=A0A0K0XYA8_9GAMM|nr:AraC family transcriptional regulator [Wenzhouxiangella marina]AKS42611.1 hypothetical protein WM2015_2248 [Wenzhouxiangella marina]MBB6085607.1 AraC-like DNA-binding protein [Wenzhouxiangella marina]
MMVISRQSSASPPDPGLPISYVMRFLDLVAREPDERRQLLDLAGLDPARLNGPPLPLSQLLDLLGLLDERLPPGWHAAPAMSLDPAQHGPLGLATISASNLGQALDTLVRFEPVRAPWTCLRLVNESDHRVLVLSQRFPLSGPGERLMEINLLALCALIAPLMGSDAQRLITELPWPAEHQATALREALPGPLITGGKRLALRVPRDCADLPCPLADPELHALMRNRCQRLLRDPEDRPISGQVSLVLLEHGGRNPGLQAVARELGRSSRSLSRHLADEGVDYRQLVDRTRQAIAEDLLRHTRIPLAEIAQQLGYADPSNFNRAFRRWTGCSPGALRRTAAITCMSNTGIS